MRTITKLIYPLFIFLGSLTMLAACSDDDGDNLALAGTYTLTEESVTGCIDVANNGTEAKGCTATDCETLTISGDGTFSVIEIDNGVTTTESGTYSTNGNQITFTKLSGTTPDSDVATFALSGSSLILTFAEDSDSCVKVETYMRAN
ncbi:lipocalin family protein [Fulvivirga sp. 29W222]|uniref:Lipocalin family protein n=1 Tax=Fulvivirga marina TaxID=2494733 RepID=A0A937KCM7_9BACT|nr:lipocalin family protein [Fulvivirga marina]MBL6447692.1 lipocalin family protein [Fulvivirga marina]